MESLDTTSDPFLSLLTDALRAGPGSPAWHEAIVKLRAGGVAGGDEYALLIKAREHLESGREYRAVRPGPEFTRKVMEGLEREPAGRKRMPSASVIAMGAGVVVIAILAVLSFWLSHGGNAAPPSELAGTYFANPVASITFNGPLPGEWKTVGPLSLETNRGLRPTPTTQPTKEYTGGALVLSQTFPADKAFVVEASFRFNRMGDDVIPQLFVTDRPQFSADRATTPHEITWLAKSGSTQVVLPDGRFDGVPTKLVTQSQMLVRIAFDRDNAAVSTDGKPTWAGANGLSATSPRTIGVRFLTRNGADKRDVVVNSVRVMGK